MRLVQTLNVDTLARNVYRVLRRASRSVIREGRTWYQRYGATVTRLGAMNGYGREESLGAFAALSPQTSLKENLRLVEMAFAGESIPHIGRFAGWASEILSFPGSAPLDVLGGRKVRAFYRCLLDPSDRWHVCIDRHAATVALDGVGIDPVRVLNWRGGYDVVADAFRMVARDVSMVPSEVQAVTWLQWRRDSRGKVSPYGE